MTPDGKKRQVGLENVARLWPTPNANNFNDAEDPAQWQARAELLKAKHANGNGAGMPLAIATKLWPTPQTADGERSSAVMYRHGQNLTLVGAAKLWPTPTATDANGSRNQTAGRTATSRHHPGQTICDAVSLWATPMACDGYKPSAGNRKTQDLTHQAVDFSLLPDPTTSAPGPLSSPTRRSLNPLFVSWLMGLPPEWALVDTDVNSSPYWEMASYLFARLTHSLS